MDHKSWTAPVFACLALCFAGAANAAPYVVGGPAAGLQTSSNSYQWDGGSYLTPFRDALENPDYFGPTGIVNQEIDTVNVDFVTTTLDDLDGFIVPWWRNDEAAPYDAAIVDFFLNGGDLWVLQDSDGRDSVGDALGVGTVGQTAISPVNGTAPLFDGPFGLANNVLQGGGEEGYLSEADVLAQGGTVIGRNAENQVIAAVWGAEQYAPGSGALIIVADIDMFTTLAIFGPALNDNGVFALNAFAFLSTSDEPIDPPEVPLPAAFFLMLAGLGGLKAFARRS